MPNIAGIVDTLPAVRTKDSITRCDFRVSADNNKPRAVLQWEENLASERMPFHHSDGNWCRALRCYH